MQSPETESKAGMLSAAQAIAPRRALQLRRVDGARAALATRLAPGREASLQAGGGLLRLRTRTIVEAPGAWSEDALVIETQAGPVRLSPARSLLRVLTAIDLGAEQAAGELDLRDLGMDGLRADLAWLFGSERTRWERAGSHPASGTTGRTQGADTAGHGTLEVSLQLEDECMRLPLRLRGRSPALRAMFDRAAWRSVAAEAAPLPDAWRMRQPLVIGSTVLTAGDARGLEIGDTIVVEHPLIDEKGSGRVWLGSRWAMGDLHLGNRNTWRVTHCADTEPYNLESSMNLDPATAFQEADLPSGLSEPDEARMAESLAIESPGTGGSQPARTDALDTLPVRLRFELGELVLSLNDLRNLGPGAVLPIDAALPPQVHVCSGGVKLGEGELVDLDGRLAVCLTRWGSAR
ncbi:type III secretion system apparatus protein YscQ/HrcQ [Roseateles sp. YR242]|uniref:FliM/FliN family flagellar motor switch protein n=1 Tax=Roseateles sp. YR242 TaxID=1855305 RepID=UPI0008AE0BB2|nr:FliM/FliN family flagellar motor switch protein [Roseateles sp. YR242]SEK63947.1 type III secretion system apparatus protein YscQ/HrcQ [Roseateles sp. YR242]